MKLSWLISGLAAAAVAIIAAMAFLYILPLDLHDRAPVQPVAFSHKKHAGDSGMSCLFCHRQAPRASIAGIPAVADCRACHLFISPDAPEIQKLMEYWANKQPLPWVRVYWLPDHVYFPHKMHIRAGLVCSACHGEVASMDRIKRSVKLTMGWCMDCHKRNKASIDCWTCHI